MKTTFLTFAIIPIFFAFSSAQNEENFYEPQTLFPGGTRVTGWFIDFTNSYSEINGKNSYLPGFAGGMVMNHNFRLGLAGKSLNCYETYLRYDNLFDEPVYLEGGYGGLYLEFSPIEDKVIHLTFPVIIGGGGASYLTKEKYPENDFDDDDWNWDWDFKRKELSTSPFFVIEPGVNVEVNITRFMKLHSGFSYRWTAGLDLQHTSGNAFNGSNLNLGLKFGKF